MKKIIVSFLAALLLLAPANAQKNSLSFEYSQFTVPQGIYLFGGIMGVVFTLGNFEFTNTVMTGAVSVEYAREINDWFKVGGAATVESMFSDTVDKDGNINGNYNLVAASLMPTAHFTWLNHPKFDMYSKIGIGVGVAGNSEISVIPAFQLSPVCMEFGGKSVRGILEVGVGMQGIISGGVRKIF